MKLAVGFVEPHEKESIEPLGERWNLQALPRGEQRHVGHASLAGACTIPAQRVSDLCRKVVADDLGSVFAREADQHGSLTHRRIDVIDGHRARVAERFSDQLFLPPLRVTMVAKPILADVHVGGRKALVVEGALAGSGETDQDGELDRHETS